MNAIQALAVAAAACVAAGDPQDFRLAETHLASLAARSEAMTERMFAASSVTLVEQGCVKSQSTPRKAAERRLPDARIYATAAARL